MILKYLDNKIDSRNTPYGPHFDEVHPNNVLGLIGALPWSSRSVERSAVESSAVSLEPGVRWVDEIKPRNEIFIKFVSWHCIEIRKSVSQVIQFDYLVIFLAYFRKISPHGTGWYIKFLPSI